jgi:hypothetical protein
MQKNTLKRQFLLALLAGVILVASGCAGYNPAGAQNPNPTVVIVQYVTQVVATVTPAPPTATPLPRVVEEEPAQPVTYNGFDPYSVEVYYPIMGCQVASRIHIGDRVAVANNRNGTLGLHMTANIGDAPIFRSLTNGELLDVVQGPYCQLNSLVWGVVDADDRIGFVAEGNGDSYWLLPVGEKVDKKLMTTAMRTIKAKRMGLPAYCKPR